MCESIDLHFSNGGLHAAVYERSVGYCILLGRLQPRQSERLVFASQCSFIVFSISRPKYCHIVSFTASLEATS